MQNRVGLQIHSYLMFYFHYICLSQRSSLVSILGIPHHYDNVWPSLFKLSIQSYAQVKWIHRPHFWVNVSSIVRMSEHYGKVMRVMLGDQEWFILSGLEEIKQFSMKEESTFHLPSKTFNEMYSFDKPLGNTTDGPNVPAFCVTI